MASERSCELLAQGRRQYWRLLDEAKELLAKLDTLSCAAMLDALEKRQEIVDSLQGFDAKLEAAAVGGETQAEFRAFREEMTSKILEVDGLMIALARDKQAAIKEKLASLTRSKSVSRAYEPGIGSSPPSWVSESI